MTKCLKCLAVSFCFSIAHAASINQGVCQKWRKYFFTKLFNWLWDYLNDVNKADQNLLLKSNDSIQCLHYSEAWGGNQSILPNLVSRAFFVLRSRYTNVDLKISLYFSIHIKTIPWKFDILIPKNYRVICPWNLHIS